MKIILQNKAITYTFLLFMALRLMAGCHPGTESPTTSFVLDDVQFDIVGGGVGYIVENDKVNETKPNFMAMVHITNNSPFMIVIDSSNFVLTNDAGIKIPYVTANEVGGTPLPIYSEVDKGKDIAYAVYLKVPNDGHYYLHVKSPLSKSVKVLPY